MKNNFNDKVFNINNDIISINNCSFLFIVTMTTIIMATLKQNEEGSCVGESLEEKGNRKRHETVKEKKIFEVYMRKKYERLIFDNFI